MISYLLIHIKRLLVGNRLYNAYIMGWGGRMPNYTENLNLEKPLQSEGYNIDIFNSNADKIDNEFGKVNNKISGIIQKSADATLTTDEQGIIDVICGEINRTMTLPSATTTHLIYTIRKADEGTGYVYIVGSNGELINDVDKAVLRFQGEAMTLVSDGVGWNIIAERRSEEAKMSSAVEVTASIFSVGENAVNGQVSVGLGGRTYTNLLGSDGDFEVDSDANGVADGWSYSTSNAVALDTDSIFGNKSQKMTSYNDGSTTVSNYLHHKINFNVDDKIYISLYAKYSTLDYNPKIQMFLRDGLIGSVLSSIPSFTVSNANYTKYSTILQATAIGDNQGIVIRDGHDATTTSFDRWIDGVLAVNLTQLFGVGNEPTLGECDQIFHFINGTKSTVLAYRIKSINKNAFDGELENGSINTSNGSDTLNGETTYARSKNYIPVLPATDYTISNDKSYTNHIIYYYDSNKNYIGYTSGVSSTFTTLSNTKYIKFRVYDSNGIDLNVKYQVEKGSSATNHLEHQSDESYFYVEDENGNIIKKNSLPNGVEDEISDDGKLVKRVSNEITLDGSLAWEFHADDVGFKKVKVPILDTSYLLANGICIKDSGVPLIVVTSSGFTWQPDIVEIGAANNYVYIAISDTDSGWAEDYIPTQADIQAYFNAHPYTLIYQLAEEKVYDIPNFKDLYCYGPHTTIVIEPAIEFEQIADSNGQIIIPNSNLPINFIESVQEKIVDSESISYIDVSYSQVNTTTIGGLIYGKKYKVVYHYPWELTTIPTMTYRYPINMAATLQDVITIQQKLQKELGSVWITLLPLADKELEMYMITEIATPATATSEEIANKVNEILQVWKG